MPDNLTPDFGCPDEDLVVLKMLYIHSDMKQRILNKTAGILSINEHKQYFLRFYLLLMLMKILLCIFWSCVVIFLIPTPVKTQLKTTKYKLFPDKMRLR